MTSLGCENAIPSHEISRRLPRQQPNMAAGESRNEAVVETDQRGISYTAWDITTFSCVSRLPNSYTLKDKLRLALHTTEVKLLSTHGALSIGELFRFLLQTHAKATARVHHGVRELYAITAIPQARSQGEKF